jgi:hypothetical protein
MRLLLLVTLTLSLAPLSAQLAQLQVLGKPEKLTTEIAAVRDANGRFCAAVKVISDMDGLSYDAYNGVVRVDDQPGQDLVYLTPDERVLEIYRSGYEPLQIILSELGIRLREKDVWQLKLSGGDASAIKVTFLIEPFDARLSLDGKQLVQGTTFQIEPGKYELKISKFGYKTQWANIHINENNAFFKFTLQPASGVTVRIDSEPANARIVNRITNETIGTTPFNQTLPATLHNLEVIKAGYVYEQLDLDMRATADTLLSLQLVKAGSIRIRSEPSAASVRIDDRVVGITPFQSDQIPVGEHRLEIVLPDHQSDVKTFTLSDDNPQFVHTARLQKYQARLSVSGLPRRAEVYVDGEKLSETPFTDLPLAYGDYDLRIDRDGYYADERSISARKPELAITDFRLKAKSPGSAMARSIFPGLGQFYSDRPTAGTMLMIGTLGAAGGAVFMQMQYQTQKSDYEEAQRAYLDNTDLDQMAALRAEMQSAYDTMSSSHGTGQMLMMAAAGLWVYNIIDAWLFFPELEQVELQGAMLQNNSPGVAVQVKL